MSMFQFTITRLCGTTMHIHTQTHTHIYIYVHIYIYIYICVCVCVCVCLLSNTKSSDDGNNSIFGLSFLNIYVRGSLNKFPDFFVWALLLIVHTWNSSHLRSNRLRLQSTCCTVPKTSGRRLNIVTLLYWLHYSSHISYHHSQATCLPWISYATQKLMLDSCKMVEKHSEVIHTFLWHFLQV